MTPDNPLKTVLQTNGNCSSKSNSSELLNGRQMLADALVAQSENALILFSAASNNRDDARVVYCTGLCSEVFKTTIKADDRLPFLTDGQISDDSWMHCITLLNSDVETELPFRSPRRQHGSPGTIIFKRVRPYSAASQSMYVARIVESPVLKGTRSDIADVLSGANCLMWEADVAQRDSEYDWSISYLNLHEALQWFNIAVPKDADPVDVWNSATLPSSLAQKHLIGKRAIRRGLDGYRQTFQIRNSKGEVRQMTESVRISQPSPEHWRIIGTCVDTTEAMFTAGELRDVVATARCVTWKANIEVFGDLYQWDFKIAHEDVVRQWLPLRGTAGKSLSAKWRDARVPEDMEATETALHTAITNNDPRVDFEFRVTLEDGSIRWMSETIQITYTSPRKCRLIGMCLDVTDRKLAEVELRRTIEGARCMVWHAKVTDLGHKLRWDIAMVNEDVGQRLWPVQNPNNQSYSVAWAMARHPADIDLADQYATRMVQTGATGYRQEFRMYLADGSVAWFAEDVRIQHISDNLYDLVGVLTDVTERKEAELALAEERNMLRTLFDGIPHAVYVKDVDHRFVTVNQSFYTRMKLSADIQVSGKRDIDFVGPDLASEFEADEDQVMSTGEAMIDREDCFRFGDDGPLWVSTTKVPLRDTAGNVIGLIGVSRDVTSYKSAIQELEQTMTSARCMVWNASVSQFGEFLEWNFKLTNDDAGRQLWPINTDGYDSYSSAWVLSKHPEDQPTVDENVRIALVTGKKFLTQQFRLILMDGSVAWLSEDIRIERISTEKWRLVGVCTDITLQKETELNLRDAMTSARCLVWHSPVSKKDGYYTWDLQIPNSDTVQRWLPLRLSPTKTFEESWCHSVLREDLAKADKVADDAMTRGQDQYTQEYRVRLADGTVRWITEYVQVERKGDDNWYLVGVCTDTTEKKILEIERENMLNVALERADTDALTGLLNHRAFHARLKIESEAALESGALLGIAMIDLDNFKFFNDAYGHLAGDDVLREVSHALSEKYRFDDTIARFGGDEFAVLIPGLTPETARQVAGRLSDELSGLTFSPPGSDATIPLSLSVGFAIFPEDGNSRFDVLNLADKRLMLSKVGSDGDSDPVERLVDEMSSSVEGFAMLNALVTAVDNKDRYTRRHSEDVLAYCVEICRELNKDELFVHEIRVAALLHDVGKIGVPDCVLRKPGPLTDGEFTAVKQHPEMGSVIVGAVPELCYTLGAVRHHHERWDGHGYPSQLSGEDIPLAARVMAVADAYSAMTTDRPYRKGMDSKYALSILEQGSGTQWDPACIEAFLRARGQSSIHQAA